VGTECVDHLLPHRLGAYDDPGDAADRDIGVNEELSHATPRLGTIAPDFQAGLDALEQLAPVLTR
jgi:hypothetical protein